MPFEEEQALFEAGHALLEGANYFKSPGNSLTDEFRRLMARARLTRRDAGLLRGIIRQLTWAVQNPR